MQALQDRARSDAGELAGELRLGASNTVGNYLVGDLLGDFVAAHPAVSVQLRVANTDAIVDEVLRHVLDLGVVEGPVGHRQLEALPWREDTLALCARPDHPLAGKRRLTMRDLAGSAWIVREPGSAMRAHSERVLAQVPSARVVLELGQVEAIKQAVAAGLGLALLPRLALGDAVAAGRVAVLSAPFLALRRQLSVVIHRSRYRGPVMDAFLRAMEAAGRSRPAG